MDHSAGITRNPPVIINLDEPENGHVVRGDEMVTLLTVGHVLDENRKRSVKFSIFLMVCTVLVSVATFIFLSLAVANPAQSTVGTWKNGVHYSVGELVFWHANVYVSVKPGVDLQPGENTRDKAWLEVTQLMQQAEVLSNPVKDEESFNNDAVTVINLRLHVNPTKFALDHNPKLAYLEPENNSD